MKGLNGVAWPSRFSQATTIYIVSTAYAEREGGFTRNFTGLNEIYSEQAERKWLQVPGIAIAVFALYVVAIECGVHCHSTICWFGQCLYTASSWDRLDQE